MKLHSIAIAAAAALVMAGAAASHDARAHSTVGGEGMVKDIGSYQIAFQLYPKYASANQSATLHFSVLEKNSSTVDGVHAAVVMKEKGSGEIVKQVPYMFYGSGDVSIPYRFDENEDYVATLLTRIEGDSKYQAAPLQADFEIPVGQATIMSPADLAFMVVSFAAALVGGIIFLLRKKV